MTELIVQNLRKQYKTRVVVQDISLNIKSGEVVGLLGPNGAGKTTVFNLLNGFIPPTAGEVLLDGQRVTGLKPHRLCLAGVGRTFQVMRPFMRMSVAHNVEAGAYVRAATDEQAKELARQAMARVGIASIAERLASALTSKELRLMELARALAGLLQYKQQAAYVAGLIHAMGELVMRVASAQVSEGFQLTSMALPWVA